MYDKLIDLLDAKGARYRVLDHAPEGRTELVSELRGNALGQAAKCVVVMVKIGKKTKCYTATETGQPEMNDKSAVGKAFVIAIPALALPVLIRALIQSASEILVITPILVSRLRWIASDTDRAQ